MPSPAGSPTTPHEDTFGPVVRLLGTGTAFHPDGRGSQAILVEQGSGCVLIDAGPTLMSAATRFGLDPARLDTVFLTHLHGDHTAGWPFLLLALRFEVSRRRPLHLVGPLGAREHLEGLTRLCYGEILEREQLDFEVVYHELPIEPAFGLERDGVVLDVWPMRHHATSIGYRLRIGGYSLAISGDTGWCPELETLSHGADLLLLECTTAEPSGQPHISLREVREQAKQLGARRIVLVHLDDATASALAADPLPGVVAGYDGMLLRLSDPASGSR